MPETEAPKNYHRRRVTTQAERTFRLAKLLQLCRIGWTTDQLEEYAMTEWDVSRMTARGYVNRMLDQCVEAVSVMDKRRIAAVTLQRFEQAYRLAASQRNPAAMVAANAQIAQHWVKAAPEITYSEPPQVGEDPEEDF